MLCWWLVWGGEDDRLRHAAQSVQADCWYLLLIYHSMQLHSAMPRTAPLLNDSHSALQRLADGATSVQSAAEALRGISREFHLKQRVLYQIMQSSKLGSRAPALRQLVTRLNYNGFADRHARPFGGAGAATAATTSPMKGTTEGMA